MATSYDCIKCRTCTICEKLCEKVTKKSGVIKCGVCKASAHASCVRPISTDASNYICSKCDPPLILAKQTRSISHTTLNSSEKTIRKRRRKIIQVNGDGNCFFNAMAINIMYKPNEWQQLLAFIPNKQKSSISKYLRLVLVRELLGERRQLYEDMAPPSVEDYEEEVNKFRAITFYNSPIGDFMPEALAIALNCSIVIYFKDPKRKAWTIQPTAIPTAFLRYNREGTGHYDAVIPP